MSLMGLSAKLFAHLNHHRGNDPGSSILLCSETPFTNRSELGEKRSAIQRIIFHVVPAVLPTGMSLRIPAVFAALAPGGARAFSI